MQFDGLHAVADYAALYTCLRQVAFADFLRERLGTFAVRCDPTARTVDFTSLDTTGPAGRRVVRARATLIAVIEPAAIVWGWAHPRGDPSGPASALREAGARFGIDDFAVPRIELPPKLSRDETADRRTEAVDVVAAAAVESTGISPYCTARLDEGDERTDGDDSDTGDTGRGGDLAVFLLDDIVLPEPSFADFATRMPSMMRSLAVNDHRVAIHGMAARQGWHINWRAGTDGGRSPICDVTDGISVAHVEFDRRARPVDFHCDLADRA
ncbi:DUF6882 domain-containing protein [Gordonia terrae]|uniref:DUF6882 domain-containing protein n=1 Tax=Gordonia terrae TaxID=2055 RepID=UPI003F6A806C